MFLVLAPLYSPEREKCGEDLFIKKKTFWCFDVGLLLNHRGSGSEVQ